MSDSIIILAGGKSERFGGVPKYNLPVCGEPVIDRTIRLCKEFRPDITPHVETRYLTFKGDASHNAAFLALRDLWSEDGVTYLMFGDVSWNRGVLRKFLCGKRFEICGRFAPNMVTGNKYPEIYGIRFRDGANWDIERWHKLALLCHPNGNWWDVAGFVVSGDAPVSVVALIPGRIRQFFWYRFRSTIEDVTRSKYFYDIGSTATDDFDYPEWYAEYVSKVTKEILEEE